MSGFPKLVEFREEGPREGFQIEPKPYPLDDRRALVEALADTGLRQIQVTSFVNPRRVPQMADAAELFAVIRRRPGVRYTALWLNEQGFQRARATPGVDLEGNLYLYASDAFSRANSGKPADAVRDEQLLWLDRYAAAGLPLRSAYIMTAFGCNFQGEVPRQAVADLVLWLKERCAERGVALPELYLADTVGWANPEETKRRIDLVRTLWPEVRIGLHLHDTRGLGGANVYAALQLGVDLFDSAVAGLGGCPFCGHGASVAAGNVCTEDMVLLCHELGIETGIDLAALVEAARLAERIIGRPLAGRLMHGGLKHAGLMRP